MKNLLAAILILAAIYGGYKMYSEKAAIERLEKNPWAARMTPLIRPRTAAQIAAGGADTGDSGFFNILYFAWQAVESGYNDIETLKRASVAAGAGTSEAARIASAVHENLVFARSMGVFDDPSNPIRMEQGEAPIARGGGFEGELLVAGHVISPLLAPEAAWALPNLRLMPEAMRDMSGARVNKGLVDLARKWAADKILHPETPAMMSEVLAQRVGK